jgi:hypothetical protein
MLNGHPGATRLGRFEALLASRRVTLVEEQHPCAIRDMAVAEDFNAVLQLVADRADQSRIGLEPSPVDNDPEESLRTARGHPDRQACGDASTAYTGLHTSM